LITSPIFPNLHQSKRTGSEAMKILRIVANIQAPDITPARRFY
jgi:hypothetical protein